MHVIGFVKPKDDRKVLSRMMNMFFPRTGCEGTLIVSVSRGWIEEMRIGGRRDTAVHTKSHDRPCQVPLCYISPYRFTQSVISMSRDNNPMSSSILDVQIGP